MLCLAGWKMKQKKKKDDRREENAEGSYCFVVRTERTTIFSTSKANSVLWGRANISTTLLF